MPVTAQTLEEGIRRAHAAGDAHAVQVLGQQLRVMQTAAPKPATKPASSFWETAKDAVSHGLSTANEAIIGVPEGMYNAASAVTDPIAHKALSLLKGEDYANATMGQVNQQRRGVVDTASNTFVNHPNPVARDVGRVAGAMMLPLPGKKLQEGGKLARAVYRGLQGGVAGAAVRNVDEGAGTPTAIGVAANVVLPPMLRVLGKPIAAIASRAGKLARGLAAPIEAPISALGQGAAERAARFKTLGVNNPTTGMVSRDATAFRTEQEALHQPGGEGLKQQVHNVESSLIAKGQELVAKHGGAPGAEATGLAAQKVLDAKRSEMQAITSKLYDEVRDTRGYDVVGKLPFLREALTEPDMIDNAAYDLMREGLSRRMERLGLNKAGGRGIDVSQAEELRKFIGKLGNNIEPGVRMMRSKLIDAIDNDVVEVIGDDAFKTARASAKARFEEFRKTFAGKMADEKIAPELVTKRLLSSTTSLDDLRSLKRSYHVGTPEQVARGTAAWKQIKAQTLDELFSGSVTSDGRLAGRQLLKNFNTHSDKLKELLGHVDHKELESLVMASRDATSYPTGLGEGTGKVAELFSSGPAKLKEGWLKFLLKSSAGHSAAFMAAGPAGNVALGVAQQTAGSAIERRAAELFMKRIELAQNPRQAAAAIAEATRAAKSNPVVKNLLEKRGIVGGAAAAAGE